MRKPGADVIALYVANGFAVLALAWAFWQRRLSFGSRWDGPLTWGIGLYGLGVAFDSPWPAMASASFSVAGKYYLLPAVGHVCYLAGTAAALKSIFVRLLSDDQIGAFMRRRIAPVVVVAAAVMLVCVIASPATSVMHTAYLYRVPLDGWLRVYFITFLVTFAALLGTAVFGGSRLREDPNSAAVLPLMVAASTGSIAWLGLLVAILCGRAEMVLPLMPLTYLAGAIAGLVCAVSWRRRVADLTR